jgi:hypothetical protein
MKTLRRSSLFVLAFVIASAAWAADLSGKWVAQVQGRDGKPHQMIFNLKIQGAQVTGTVTAPRGEQTISDGKMAGDQITFSAVAEIEGNKVKFLYTGKVVGSEIKFTRQREGQKANGREFSAKRG